MLYNINVQIALTRMHSSRMDTARLRIVSVIVGGGASPVPPGVEVRHAWENITFIRFGTPPLKSSLMIGQPFQIFALFLPDNVQC